MPTTVTDSGPGSHGRPPRPRWYPAAVFVLVPFRAWSVAYSTVVHLRRSMLVHVDNTRSSGGFLAEVDSSLQTTRNVNKYIKIPFYRESNS